MYKTENSAGDYKEKQIARLNLWELWQLTGLISPQKFTQKKKTPKLFNEKLCNYARPWIYIGIHTFHNFSSNEAVLMA